MVPPVPEVDSKGNLYIADTNNNIIRKVDASTGIITTIAGNGTYGYGGDGGQASGAVLRNPEGMALDSAGNLYFADSGNDLIRKINLSSGIISVTAGKYGNWGWSGDGGPATNAGIFNPTDVALDGAGNLYIADNSGRTARSQRLPESSTRLPATGTGVMTATAARQPTRKSRHGAWRSIQPVTSILPVVARFAWYPGAAASSPQWLVPDSSGIAVTAVRLLSRNCGIRVKSCLMGRATSTSRILKTPESARWDLLRRR